MFRVTVHGGTMPLFYHFETEHDLVTWLLSRSSILEVTVSEVQ